MGFRVQGLGFKQKAADIRPPHDTYLGRSPKSLYRERERKRARGCNAANILFPTANMITPETLLLVATFEMKGSRYVLVCSRVSISRSTTYD